MTSRSGEDSVILGWTRKRCPSPSHDMRADHDQPPVDRTLSARQRVSYHSKRLPSIRIRLSLSRSRQARGLEAQTPS